MCDFNESGQDHHNNTMTYGLLQRYLNDFPLWRKRHLHLPSDGLSLRTANVQIAAFKAVSLCDSLPCISGHTGNSARTLFAGISSEPLIICLKGYTYVPQRRQQTLSAVEAQTSRLKGLQRKQFHWYIKIENSVSVVVQNK